MNEWQLFDEVLNERHIPRQVLIYPERYMDQYNVTRRRGAIREMGKRGLNLDQLESLTPFTKRYLREIIAANAFEPELPLMENALSLRDQNGAQADLNPSGTDGV
jgi:hypothetical protein